MAALRGRRQPCVDIPGATGATYSPAGADAGHAIVVEVTATNPGGSATEASAPTAPVLAAPPVNTAPPSVTGTPADGGTLTADPGTWSGTTPIDFTYQWQRCEARRHDLRRHRRRHGRHLHPRAPATSATRSPSS